MKGLFWDLLEKSLFKIFLEDFRTKNEKKEEKDLLIYAISQFNQSDNFSRSLFGFQNFPEQILALRPELTCTERRRGVACHADGHGNHPDWKKVKFSKLRFLFKFFACFEIILKNKS